jgi:hypothetical protein
MDVGRICEVSANSCSDPQCHLLWDIGYPICRNWEHELDVGGSFIYTINSSRSLLLIQICQVDNHQWHNTFTNFLPRCLFTTRARAYCHPFPWHCFPPSPPISAPPYPWSALAITHTSLECVFFLLGNQWLSNQLDVFAIL